MISHIMPERRSPTSGQYAASNWNETVPTISLASREGMFLVNNLLLATFAAVVGVGTLYPIIHEAVNGARLTVGRPFFDVFAVWITLALRLAMIIGVVAPYRRAAWSEVWDRQRAAATVGLAAGAGLVVFAGLRAPYVIVVVVLATTIVAGAAVELAKKDRGKDPDAAVAGLDGGT